MSAEEVHKVLFPPSHYSDLQPIKVVWAMVKRNMCVYYTENKTV